MVPYEITAQKMVCEFILAQAPVLDYFLMTPCSHHVTCLMGQTLLIHCVQYNHVLCSIIQVIVLKRKTAIAKSGHLKKFGHKLIPIIPLKIIVMGKWIGHGHPASN